MKIVMVLIFSLQIILAHAGQCDLIELDTDFVGEQDFNKAIYIPKEKRGEYEIKINNRGQILGTDGDLLDTRLLPNSSAMFVYSKEGKIYLSTKRQFLRFHHSSLVGGEKVIVAGNIKVTRGYIEHLNDASPMYVAKEKENLKAAIYRLKVLGANLKKMRVFFQSDF